MDDALIGPAQAPDLHVMTYNIRRRITRMPPHSSDLWSHRKHLLRRLLEAEQPTLLGVQEALLDQARWVGESLGPSYVRIGYGRNANREGESCPVYYDSRRLEALSWRQYALSNTPTAPGSRSWGNLVPRVLVAAEFRDLVTGAEFRAFNTHFDHRSSKARLQSARMVTRLIDAGTGPVVVMGDANAGVRSAPYRELMHNAGLADAWLVTENRLTPEWTTYSAYREPRLGGKRIDWMFVGGGIEVKSIGINAARFDGWAPSDHEPVQALLRLGGRPALV